MDDNMDEIMDARAIVTHTWRKHHVAAYHLLSGQQSNTALFLSENDVDDPNVQNRLAEMFLATYPGKTTDEINDILDSPYTYGAELIAEEFSVCCLHKALFDPANTPGEQEAVKQIEERFGAPPSHGSVITGTLVIAMCKQLMTTPSDLPGAITGYESLVAKKHIRENADQVRAAITTWEADQSNKSKSIINNDRISFMTEFEKATARALNQHVLNYADMAADVCEVIKNHPLFRV